MRGNFKSLNKDVVKEYEKRYIFKLCDDNILVETYGNDNSKRITYHKLGDMFITSIYDNNKKRYVKILKDAQYMWVDLKGSLNLGIVQVAINVLKQEDKEITKDSIIELINDWHN